MQTPMANIRGMVRPGRKEMRMGVFLCLMSSFGFLLDPTLNDAQTFTTYLRPFGPLTVVVVGLAVLQKRTEGPKGGVE